MNDQVITIKLGAIVIKDTVIEPQPASADPKKCLMGIPREIRNEIYKLLLTKSEAVHIRFERYVDAWCHVPGKVEHDLKGQTSQLLHIGPKKSTSILRVNKQACSEGTDILYGDNAFKAYDAHAFNVVFVNGKATDRTRYTGIGSINAAKIRSLFLGVPLAIRSEYLQNHENQTAHAEFLGFVCRQFPNLQKLELEILFGEYQPGSSDREACCLQEKLKIETVALLKTAARVTKYHPVLRKVVWSRCNGFFFHHTDDNQVCHISAYLHVQILPAGSWPILKGESVIKKDAFGRNFQAKRFVLDSLQIRRRSHEDRVFRYRVVKGHFKLDDDASTSEVDPSEIRRWAYCCCDNNAAYSCLCPYGRVLPHYDPPAEYDPENHAMVIARNKMWGADQLVHATVLAR